MKLSVVIPAYNEEKYLPATLAALKAAIVDADAEIIVVDNESTDATRDISESNGVRVLNESEHNIARVRNTGAEAATGETIVFLDADTLVPPGIFEAILAATDDERCLGGSVGVVYEPVSDRPIVSFFMKLWPILGNFTKMRGGALQFCRSDIFRELSGYDETIYVGEDIDFHWRLDKLANSRGCFTAFIEEPPVRTSSRRWQKMGTLRMIIFTHPVTIFLAWRVRSFWKDWYERPIR